MPLFYSWQQSDVPDVYKRQTEKYAYNEEIRNKKREELQIGDRFCIGHVGRFAEQKNHAYLIDIFYEVHKKKEDAVLLLVGDGPLQEDVKARVHQYGLDDAVIFAGSRDDVGEPVSYTHLDVYKRQVQVSSWICTSQIMVTAMSMHSELIR